MELNDFLSRLENVKKCGTDQYHANCPACGDRHGHLYISAADGKILIDCKKGCKFEDVVSALGLHRKQMFAERPQWEFLREHVYTDGNDVPVAKKQIYRKDSGKTAVWYRYDKGKWTKGLGGMKVPLYRLKSVASADKIYLVEGEKDAETMERLGFTATTSPNGAGSKLRNDLVHYFKDKDVVILADNDDVGADYARDTAERIRPKARSVKVVPSAEIYPELKAKGDISDIAEAVGDEEAKRLLLAAEDTAQSVSISVEAVGKTASVTASGTVSGKAFFKERGIDPAAYSFNDRGNSQLFADVFGNELRWNVTAKEWYIYSGGRWQRDTGGMYASMKMKMLQDALFQYFGEVREDLQKSYIDNVMRMTRLNVRETILKDARDVNWFENADLDSDIYLFNCKNGTLDLKTMKFKPHDQNDLISRISNVVYDPKATSPDFEKFVTEIMSGDKDKMRFLQKALGYSLTGSAAEECFFILYGATTRNGKGTLTSTITYMMGDGYAASAVPETFAMKMNRDSRQASGDIARLAGVRFLNVSEPQKNMQLDVALVKTLTGRDRITARHLHEREFEFEPEFKIFMNSNFLPAINDETIFSSERVKVIPFERHFDGADRDVTLKDRLRTEQNISGIFNWCLEGLRMYREEGLKVPLSVSLATAEYADSSDKYKAFIKECLVEDAFSSCKAKDAYYAYKQWCSESGFRYENKSKWLMAMRGKGIVRDRATVNGMTAPNVIVGYRVSDFYTQREEQSEMQSEIPFEEV